MKDIKIDLKHTDCGYVNWTDCAIGIVTGAKLL
jgi:hypothetical protein